MAFTFPMGIPGALPPYVPPGIPGGGGGAAAGYAQGVPAFGGFPGATAAGWGAGPAGGCGFGYGFGSMGPGFMGVPFANHMPSPPNVSVGNVQDIVRSGFNPAADKTPVTS